MGSNSLLQGIFLTQGLNLCLLNCRQILYRWTTREALREQRQSVTVSIVSPSICHEVTGPDAMILVFWMLSFKPTFPLSPFTFIKRFFSSSLLSALRVVSYAYLRLLIFLPAILISACVYNDILSALNIINWVKHSIKYFWMNECVLNGWKSIVFKTLLDSILQVYNLEHII